jgi:hypothetical protein
MKPTEEAAHLNLPAGVGMGLRCEKNLSFVHLNERRQAK